MALHLDFLNKNLFRKFPFKASANLTDSNGHELPHFLIANVSISTTLERSALYIKQVFLNFGFITIVIANHDTDPANAVTLGYFSGSVTSDFQTFKFTSFERFTSGFLITGFLEDISKVKDTLDFSFESAELEPSTVFCYAPPSVTSFTSDGKSIRGHIKLGTLVNLDNTISAQPDNFFELAVRSNTSILSLKDYSSEFRNCPTPVILSINDTVPYPTDASHENDSNIYVLGVEPIEISPDDDTASIVVTTSDVTLDTLCTKRQKPLPPIDPLYLVNRTGFVGKDNYFTKSETPVVSFMGATDAEFLLWPSFISTYQTTVTATVGTTLIFDPSAFGATPLLDAGQSGVITKIRYQTNAGTVSVRFKVGATFITTAATASSSGIIVVPSALTFLPNSTFSIQFLSVTGAANVSCIVFYKKNYS